jgi:large conductance mechanosensitive channel
MIAGFKKFILRGNIVDMAVGIVIGVAFGGLVSAFVKDLLTPLVGAMIQAPDFSALKFQFNKSEFLYGEFINVLVSFVLVSVAVYFFVVLPINKLINRQDDKPTTKKCHECFTLIPKEAKRCPNCTSQLL